MVDLNKKGKKFWGFLGQEKPQTHMALCLDFETKQYEWTSLNQPVDGQIIMNSDKLSSRSRSRSMRRNYVRRVRCKEQVDRRRGEIWYDMEVG